mmetsp:Transcript_2806/g.9894  ORF Transcript_2806/g.9894 Transcript_2806/m.9894 type:complete len:240 (+) Transcript_2806:70-789(+)
MGSRGSSLSFSLVCAATALVGALVGAQAYSPSGPMLQEPWFFNTLVAFEGVQNYIAQGWLLDSVYREDGRYLGVGTGSSYIPTYFVYEEAVVYVVGTGDSDQVTDCSAMAYPTLPWSPTMFSNATYLGTASFHAKECDLWTGTWNGLDFTLFNMPPTPSTLYNIPLYFETTYCAAVVDGNCLGETPVSYTFYDFHYGQRATALVAPDTVSPPPECNGALPPAPPALGFEPVPLRMPPLR